MLGKDLKKIFHHWWFTFLVFLYIGFEKIIKEIKKIAEGSFELQLYVLKKTKFTDYLNEWARNEILSKKSSYDLKVLYSESVGDKKLQQLLLWFLSLKDGGFYTKVLVFNEADDENVGVWEIVGSDLAKWVTTKERVSLLVENIKEIDSSYFVRSNPESLDPKKFWEWMESYIYQFDCSKRLNFLVKKGLETLGPETH